MKNHLLESNEKDKQQLILLADQLKAIQSDPESIAALEKIQKNLQDERFRLVILGQFKRGKSTFINALLGKEVLPTDVIPATAVITEIRYGSRPGCRIHFHEGESRDAALNELSGFVTENENPANRKGVDRVLVFHPASILQKGLILVDTPGVGSIHQHNTRLTQEYIPNVDAAIFLFSADPPLTELEQEFLKIILPVVPKVFFILNKKDYLNAEEVQRVLDFNRKILNDISDHSEQQITPLSALQGLQAKKTHSEKQLKESGLAGFEQQLHHFLIHYRGRLLILSNAERIIKFCEEWKNLLQLNRQAQTLSLEALEEKLDKFKTYASDLQRKDQRLRFLLDGLRSQIMEYYDRRVKIFFKESIQRIQDQIGSFLTANQNMNHKKLIDAVEEQINQLIIDHFEPFRLIMEKQVRKRYEDEIEHLNNEAWTIINDLYQYSATLFQLSHLKHLQESIWRYQSRFFYRTWEAEVTLDLIENRAAGFIPGSLFMNWLKKKSSYFIRQKLERQCGRLRADILYRLQDNNRTFLYEYKKVLSDTEDKIEQLIENEIDLKRQGEQALAQVLQEHQKQEAEIDRILSRAERIRTHWAN